MAFLMTNGLIIIWHVARATIKTLVYRLNHQCFRIMVPTVWSINDRIRGQ
jgi:hypothetical protein